ncbi:MAG: DUF2934 domain-containing protein [Actinomycetota bacterium]
MAQRIGPHDEFPDDMIRERAHHIWEREGRPEGRADDHWQMARTELAMEQNPGVATEPTPTAGGNPYNPHPEPVEPIEAVENQGSFPGLADQDEEPQYPKRRRPAKGKGKAAGA